MLCSTHRKIERRRMMAADFKEVSVNPVFTGLRKILKKEKINRKKDKKRRKMRQQGYMEINGQQDYILS